LGSVRFNNDNNNNTLIQKLPNDVQKWQSIKDITKIVFGINAVLLNFIHHDSKRIMVSTKILKD